MGTLCGDLSPRCFIQSNKECLASSGNPKRMRLVLKDPSHDRPGYPLWCSSKIVWETILQAVPTLYAVVKLIMREHTGGVGTQTTPAFQTPNPTPMGSSSDSTMMTMGQTTRFSHVSAPVFFSLMVSGQHC